MNISLQTHTTLTQANMEKPYIAESPHGGQQLHLKGHIYHKRLNQSGKTYWRCSRRRTDGCNASAITHHSGKRIDVIKASEHQHTPIDEQNDNQSVISQGSEDKGSYQEDEVSNHETEAIGISDEDVSEERESSDEESSDEECGGEGVWEAWQEGSDDEQDEVEEDEEYDDREEIQTNMDGLDLLEIKVKRYMNILRTLRQAKIAMRESILKGAGKGFICLLCEICWNIVHGQINFSKTEKYLLRPFSEHILDLASKEMGWEEKRDCLAETAEDAFIPILLNVVWPYIK